MLRKTLVFITHKVGLYNRVSGIETKLVARRQRRRLRKYGLEALIMADEAFRSVGSFMFLNFGTLLGAHREKNFIAHDSDLDAGVLHELMPPNLPELLRGYGFKHLKDSCVRKTGRLTEDVYSYKGLHLDFFVYFKKDSDLFCYLGRKHETKPPAQADSTDGFPCKLSWVTAAGFTEINFLGHLFYAPRNTPQWLEQIYGSSFMSPVKQWSENSQPTRITAHTERLHRRFYKN
jgi:phosphorylcholine metabolism protein LicD